MLLKNPMLLLAFGLGSGLSKYGPGTVGTLCAVPFYFYLSQLGLLDYVLVVGFASVAGVFICGYAAQLLGVHDHRGIVWDEFAGLWITMIAVPFAWHWLLIGFIYFRILDILKPWPIAWLDKHVHGGLGIMIDDVCAGLVACIALHATIYFSRGLFL